MQYPSLPRMNRNGIVYDYTRRDEGEFILTLDLKPNRDYADLIYFLSFRTRAMVLSPPFGGGIRLKFLLTRSILASAMRMEIDLELAEVLPDEVIGYYCNDRDPLAAEFAEKYAGTYTHYW